MKELGFALAFGVLLDTLVVRPLLVPSFVILLQRRGSGSKKEQEETERTEPAVKS